MILKRNYFTLSLILLAGLGFTNSTYASATNAVVYRLNQVPASDINISNPTNVNGIPMADISYQGSTGAIDIKNQIFLLKFETKEAFTNNINTSFTDALWSYTRQLYQSENRSAQVKLENSRDGINYYTVCYTKIYALGSNQNAKVYVCSKLLEVSIYSGVIYTGDGITKFLEEKAKQDEITAGKYGKWFTDMFDAGKSNSWTRGNGLMTGSKDLNSYIDHLYFDSGYNVDKIVDVVYNFDFNSKIASKEEFTKYITYYCSVLGRKKEEAIKKQEAEQEEAQTQAKVKNETQQQENARLRAEYNNRLTQEKKGEDYANNAINKLKSYGDKITFTQAVSALNKTIANLEKNKTDGNSISTDKAIILLKLEKLSRYEKQYSL